MEHINWSMKKGSKFYAAYKPQSEAINAAVMAAAKESAEAMGEAFVQVYAMPSKLAESEKLAA